MVCTGSWGKILTQEALSYKALHWFEASERTKSKGNGRWRYYLLPFDMMELAPSTSPMSRESGCSMFSSVYIQISPFFNLSPAFFLLGIRDLLEVRNELFLEFFCFCMKFPSLLFSVFKAQLQENDCIFKHCHWGPLIFTFCIKLVINPPGFIIFSLISILGAQQ